MYNLEFKMKHLNQLQSEPFLNHADVSHLVSHANPDQQIKCRDTRSKNIQERHLRNRTRANRFPTSLLSKFSRTVKL